MKNNMINFGVISCSVMARRHMEAICYNPNTNLVAVCDIQGSLAGNAAADFGVESWYTDYQDLLKNGKIDAVVICTPDQMHREMTVAALAAGKHVLCEKPMALTWEDCEAMINAADHSSAQLMIGQICRYTPSFIQAKKMIERGDIGELFFVESEYAHDYSEILKGTHEWRSDPLRHGFLGGGCHAVDLLRWIAGNPIEVTAYSNRKMLKTLATDDCTIAIMKFPNDVIGKVFVSTGCKRDYTMRSVFYGSKGTIIADNTSPYLTVYTVGEEGQERIDGMERFTVPVLYPVPLNNHNTAGEIEELANAILNGQKVATDVREGAATVKTCLAAVRSTQTGLPQKLDGEGPVPGCRSI